LAHAIISTSTVIPIRRIQGLASLIAQASASVFARLEDDFLALNCWRKFRAWLAQQWDVLLSCARYGHVDHNLGPLHRLARLEASEQVDPVVLAIDQTAESGVTAFAIEIGT